MAKSKTKPKVTPPTNVSGLENKLIALTMSQVERELVEGTASSQVLTHFLRLATEKQKAEVKKMELESKLLEAKIEGMKQAAKIEEVKKEVIAALKSYSPPVYNDDLSDLF